MAYLCGIIMETFRKTIIKLIKTTLPISGGVNFFFL